MGLRQFITDSELRTWLYVSDADHFDEGKECILDHQCYKCGGKHFWMECPNEDIRIQSSAYRFDEMLLRQ